MGLCGGVLVDSGKSRKLTQLVLTQTLRLLSVSSAVKHSILSQARRISLFVLTVPQISTSLSLQCIVVSCLPVCLTGCFTNLFVISSHNSPWKALNMYYLDKYMNGWIHRLFLNTWTSVFKLLNSGIPGCFIMWHQALLYKVKHGDIQFIPKYLLLGLDNGLDNLYRKYKRIWLV
jgi:hypothetical protein